MAIEEKIKEMERSKCDLQFGNKCRSGEKKNPEANRSTDFFMSFI